MQAASVTAPAGSTRHTALENRLVKPKNTLFHNKFEIWSVACWGGWERRGGSHRQRGVHGARHRSPGLVPGPPLPWGDGPGPAAGWQRLRAGQLRPRWRWEARAPSLVSASREQLKAAAGQL